MSDETFKLNIDGIDVEVPKHYTLMQACEAAGAEIPRFCYHERLSVAGNCRMCLVEWEGAPKPIASCAQTVGEMRPNRDGSAPVVRTGSDYVQKAREGVMEFLLINHPLDCPICDQGGECDLQDQAMAYGRSGSRYELNKRAVDDKEMGPLVNTIMTRCIQCTRCVRFAAEVAGVEEIGMISRGEDAEITTYLEESLTSELSGNVIDLCPVGALTSKPYAFNARPWELRKVPTVDVMDAMGAAIRVDAKGDEVLRVLPREYDEVNEEWISDKTRFAWDGLRRQRLDRPYIRRGGRLRPADWDEALLATAKALSGAPERIGAVAGDLIEVEQAHAALTLLRSLGVQSTDCRMKGAAYGADGVRESYILNPTFMGVEEADALLLIGTNPRVEAPVFNARIRKAWLWNNLSVALVGEAAELTYAYAHLGTSADAIERIDAANFEAAGGEGSAPRPMILLGEGALAGEHGEATRQAALRLAADCGALAEDWTGIGMLHHAAGRVGALDVGFVPGESGADTAAMVRGGQIDTLLLLGADEPYNCPETRAAGTTIYVGSHGDRGAQMADIILPCAAYTETNATFVNTEGRVQQTMEVVAPKGMARDGWAIFRALSERLGKTLPFDSLGELRNRLSEQNEMFRVLGAAPGSSASASEALRGSTAHHRALSPAPLMSPVRDFYLTNPIARASRTMAECQAVATAVDTPLAAE